ncbi:MAG: hypothetical protein HOL02_19530 [Rhodospirillaceae bacterium]|nr:hypothetical protein [Rhodospirillaceae bacterium]MBT6512625.1 hypothetical protein [Rhodospirillaceae bacterium]MBT7613124.1 hypothetical protein [Rhodospirillaceae bacterium]MBT7649292.1 hypothetical protein [Rhodospirillaceae bacterium]
MKLALLVTGAYGTGKTSVVEELAQRLEDASLSYGAIGLDWLMWFDAGLADEQQEQVFLANLATVTGNYVHAGAERLLLAGAVADQASLDAIRGVLPMPLHVVRLILPLARIEARLGDAITSGRANDKRNAATWLSSATGVGIEDTTFTNDRPISETAQAIANWMGWQI